MTTTISTNSENWPVNIVTVSGLTGQPLERAKVEELCAVLYSLTRKQQLYANIVDLRLCGPVSASERQLIADSFKQHAEAYRNYLVAVAVVVPSKMMRGVLTAIGWLYPYPCPIEFVSSIEAGEQVLKKILATRGVAWAGLLGSGRTMT